MTGWAVALMLYVIIILACGRAKQSVGEALAWPILVPLALVVDAFDTYQGSRE